MFGLILLVIATALIFDFFNGFHDAANSVATVVATRVLSPTVAVAWAALFNFVAAFVFGTGVAETISKGLVDPAAVDVWIVFAGLLGAIVWDIVTWWMALPTSSSHAVISALAGAAILKGGFGVLESGWGRVILFLFVSPIVGMVLGAAFQVVVNWLFFRINRHRGVALFRRLQLVSAGTYSLMHGTNDAQKTMGVIVALLVAGGHKAWAEPQGVFLGRHWDIAPWIVLSCHAAMGCGTALGGWRVVKTVGTRITPHLEPTGGFCAEMAAAASILLATFAKTPISTTHAIGGGVAGVGMTRGWRSVRWIWGKRIVWAWLMTFPGAGLIGAAAYLLLHWTVARYFPALPA